MPLASIHVDAAALRARIGVIRSGFHERHALPLEQRTLLVGTAKGKARSQRPVTKNHPMAWDDSRLGVRMQGETDETRITRIPGERGDLTVGRHSAGRNGAHHRIHAAME